MASLAAVATHLCVVGKSGIGRLSLVMLYCWLCLGVAAFLLAAAHSPPAQLVINEMAYGHQYPWPANANGGGHSLQRLSTLHSGNDPANWFAGPPTPGQHQATITTAPELTLEITGGQLQLTWPATHTGCRLEAQTNSLATGLSANWFTVPGTATTNQITIPINSENETVFFRLVYP